MGTATVRIGIAGCGQAARVHLDRLLVEEGVAIVGCADPDLAAARALADRAAGAPGGRRTRPGVRRPSRAAPPGGPRGPGDLHAPPGALPPGHGRPPGRLPRLHRKAAVDQPPGGRRHRRAGPRARFNGRGRPSVPAGAQPGRGAAAAGRRVASGRCSWSPRRSPAPGWRPSAGPKAPGDSTRPRPAAASSRTSATIWWTPCSWTTGQVGRGGRRHPEPPRARHRPGHGRRDPAGRRHPRHAGDLRRLARPALRHRILRRARPAQGDRRVPRGGTGRARPRGRSPCPRPPDGPRSIDGDFVAALRGRGPLSARPTRPSAPSGSSRPSLGPPPPARSCGSSDADNILAGRSPAHPTIADQSGKETNELIRHCVRIDRPGPRAAPAPASARAAPPPERGRRDAAPETLKVPRGACRRYGWARGLNIARRHDFDRGSHAGSRGRLAVGIPVISILDNEAPG